MFLTGFVLLANFFVKLTEVLVNLVPKNRATLEETLATSDAPCLPKMPNWRLKEITLAQKARLAAYSAHLDFFSSRSNQRDHEMDDVNDTSDDETMRASALNNQNGIATAVVENESGSVTASNDDSPRAEEQVAASVNNVAPQVTDTTP